MVDNNQRVRVVVALTIKSENQEALLPQIRELEEATRKEEGCLDYGCYQNFGNKELFNFVELWESEAHLDSHFKTAHFIKFSVGAKELMQISSFGKFHDHN